MFYFAIEIWTVNISILYKWVPMIILCNNYIIMYDLFHHELILTNYNMIN